MRKFILALGASLALAGVAGAQPMQQEPLPEGKPPPKWSVTAVRDLKKPVKIENFRGKWLVVEFWGYW
ncbi:MAG: hypothetical protein CHACPFDD_00788 [Phycisphaerae bacterium]|nr:hypothetical protein [Phycisphaerae bacterium]